MDHEEGDKRCRTLKWLWLLLQALILPLAVFHATATPLRWPLAIPAPLLFFAAAVFLVLWLIAQSLLSMARFPLTVKGASVLIGGTLVQFAFTVAAGDSLFAAVYGVFFATLAALAAVLAIMVAVAVRRRLGPPLARLASLLALLPAAGLLWFLATPLLPAFSRLEPWQRALEWLVLAANAGLIAYSLYGFSIFAPPLEKEAAYAREWEKWAAPTIIVLILSAAAAIVLAAVRRGG